MGIPLRKRNARRSVAGVSMAPMIDMVFLLLVFFMTASAMSQAGIKLDLELPESTSSAVPKDLSQRLIVSVDQAGDVYSGTTKLDAKALQRRLEQFRASQPGAKLRIRAHKATPFSAIRAVMEAAAEAGIDSYLYATYQAEGNTAQ